MYAIVYWPIPGDICALAKENFDYIIIYINTSSFVLAA